MTELELEGAGLPLLLLRACRDLLRRIMNLISARSRNNKKPNYFRGEHRTRPIFSHCRQSVLYPEATVKNIKMRY